MINDEAIDTFLAAALRDEYIPWPQIWDGEENRARVKARALYHGIPLLLTDRPSLPDTWPREVLSDLRGAATAQITWEFAHRQVLSTLLETLAGRGIDALVMTGTALAYTLYKPPAARRRGKSDLLIRDEDLDEVQDILTELGFSRPHLGDEACADMPFTQLWQFGAERGHPHCIALHWRVTNSRALGILLDAEEYMERAVPLPNLSAAARGTDPVTGLIQGFVNRAAPGASGNCTGRRGDHGAERLIWAMDYHLQAREFSDSQWRDLAEIGARRGIAAICLEGLAFAQKRMGTTIPAGVLERLEAAPQKTRETTYIRQTSPFIKALLDFHATPGLTSKVRFLMAKTIPSPRHLHRK